MFEFKRDHFCKQHPGKDFPVAGPVSFDKAEAFRRDIRIAFTSDPNKAIAPGDLCAAATQQMDIIANPLLLSHEAPDLSQLPIARASYLKCIISLDYLDTFYFVSAPDLLRYINHIWYGPSDELVIIDDKFQWIAVVDYAGAVWVKHAQ